MVPTVKTLALITALALLALTACTAAAPGGSISDGSTPGSSISDSGTPDSGAPDSGTSHSPNPSAPYTPDRSGGAPGLPDEAPPPYTDEHLEDCISYLQGALTDEQHGGIHRVSDYGGSGLAIHGGPDRPYPYILIWAVDEAAAQAAADSYSGPAEVPVTLAPADYSMRRLNSIIDELMGSAAAGHIGGMYIGADNRVLLDVTTSADAGAAADFLKTYPHRDAVVIMARTAENPVT